jgi:hypothetical protein
LAKELTVDGGDCLPILDPHQQGAGTDHVSQRGASLLQRGGNDLTASPRLRSGVANASRAPIGAERSCPGHRNDVTDTNSARNPCLGLVWTAAGDGAGQIQAYRDRQAMQIWTQKDGEWFLTYTTSFVLQGGE